VGSADGVFIWLMGLAGVGKTTIGHALADKLRNRFGETIWLDGDSLRGALAIQDHSKAVRIETGLKYLQLAKILISQSRFVVLTSIGLQRPFEEYARQNFSKYYQVLIEREMESLTSEKEFYRKDITNVMGVDLQPDKLNFDLIINNNKNRRVDELVCQLEKEIGNWLEI